MRILHLTTFLQGGAGLAIASLARAQQQAGHHVTVVTSKTGAPGYGNYDGHLAALAAARVDVHEIDSLFSRDPEATARVAAFVTSHLAPGNLDVIHAHAAMPSLVGLTVRAGLPRHVPVVQTMHGWGVAKSEGQQRMDVVILNAVDRVIVPAHTSAELLRSLGVSSDHLVVVPYGVATMPSTSALIEDPAAELRESIRRRHGNDVAVLCSVGTIGARKNQRLLVEALSRVTNGRKAVCVFVGEGDVDGLRQHAAAHGVADRVVCTGYRSDARQLAAAADWLVLPSQSEGQPLSIIEAYCDQVPVIASDIPELEELVDADVTGLLFEAGSASALAAALERAVSLDSIARHRLCQKARARYDSKFSLTHMVRSYMRVYRDVSTVFGRSESWKAS